MEKNKKQQLNEFGLIAILSPLAIYWGFKLFGRLLKNFQSWMDGRDVNITNALKKIYKNITSDKTFIAKAMDIADKYGLTDVMINHLMTTPEITKELSKFKNDKNINFEELKAELRITLARGIQNEAEQRGATSDLAKSLK
jgi:DNA-directed RNA polymerase delta subunit